MSSDSHMLGRAERHLQAACPHMRRLIRRLGPCSLRLERDGFWMLVRSITSQQISSLAARAILRRLEQRITPSELCAEAVRDCGEDALRAAGYSQRKASYLLGLADAVLRGDLDLGATDSRSDDEVIEQLTRLKGIGVWTSQMFLIFSLGRPDVLPYDDLGVRQALRNFHGLQQLPGRREVVELAKPWRPYASIASWYCWRSLDAQAVAESA